MKKINKYKIIGTWAVAGILTLSVLSIFQKILIYADAVAFFSLKGYIIPIIWGSLTGILLGFYIFKNKNLYLELLIKNDELEEHNGEMGVMNDQLQNTLAQIEESKERIEIVDSLKTKFLENISHEIRTPMNGILGFSGLLVNESSTEKKLEYTELINRSCNRLIRTIETILEVSQLQCNQILVKQLPCNISEFTYSVFKRYVQHASDKKINFQYLNHLENTNRQILTDSKLLETIFVNLLDNAFKFTKIGSIKFIVSERNERIQIKIEDTGIGITSNEMRKIFDFFAYGDDEKSMTYGGIGLGLSLAKGYTQLLGGEILAESTSQIGSTFTVFLPMNMPDTTEPKHTADALSDSRKHLLIAEDDDTSYFLIQNILDCENYTLQRAKNGLEALTYFKEFTDFDLVITDLKMPEADGFYVISEIRKLNQNIQILVQTAFSSGADLEKARTLGANDIITKPYTHDTLKMQILKCLQKK